jgi:NAD(P)-dependent dehydrogenase (short-subunit alcohol dehydrogenase family)
VKDAMWPRTKEIGEVIVFLASPRASYVTGANVAVDGGRTPA